VVVVLFGGCWKVGTLVLEDDVQSVDDTGDETVVIISGCFWVEEEKTLTQGR